MTAPVISNPNFRRLWAAQAVSDFGARITLDSLPMMAVMGLAATPGQLGLLGALASGPALIVGLAAGGWVDRARKRRVLIAADRPLRRPRPSSRPPHPCAGCGKCRSGLATRLGLIDISGRSAVLESRLFDGGRARVVVRLLS